MTKPANPSKHFFALAISQALMRAGYEVFSEAAVTANHRADLLIRLKNGQMLVIEIKTAPSVPKVQKAADEARKYWQNYPGKVAAAVGVSGTALLYADEQLASKIRETSPELVLHRLPKTPKP